MKKPEELHKELINENYIDMKPINTIDTRAKDPFWRKFESFLAEGESLQPIVNNEEKVNTKEEDEKIKNNEGKYSMDNKLAGSFKESKTVENIASHNYNYDPSVDNINNVNAQEMLTGIQCEINYNKEYGYPVSIYFDMSKMIADEEIGYYISDFKILNND